MHCSRSKTLLVLIVLFGMFTFAFAQEGENVTPVTSIFDYWDFGYEVAGTNEYLVVATGRTGIRITSYQDGEGISELSSWNTPGRALDLVVRDGVIYVADGSAGLRIIDFSEPSLPEEIGSLATPEDATGIAISGNLAFLSCSNYGLFIVDISTPSDPFQVGMLPIEGTVFDITLNDHYAYITHIDGVKIVDVNDLQDLQIISEIPLPGDTQKLVYQDGYLFVSKFNSGFTVIDVSNPETPISAGSYTGPMFTRNLTLSGNTLYVSYGSFESGVALVDISNPETPSEISTIDIPGDVFGVTITQNRLNAVTRNIGLSIWDISLPPLPMNLAVFDAVGKVTSTVTDGEYIYGTGGKKGVRILSVDGNAIEYITEYEIDEETTALLLDQNFLWVGTSSSLLVLDRTTPWNLTEIDSYPLGDKVNSLKKSGNYIYAACNLTGLRIIDVSQPSNPVEVGSYDTPGHAMDVAVSGSYALVADAEEGMQIIDISLRDNPLPVGSFTTNGTCSGVDFYGVKAVVADSDSRIWILDLTNPAIPSLDAGLLIPGEPYSVSVDDRYAYIGAQEEGGIRIVDIYDYENPVESGYYNTPWYAANVQPFDDLALVADWYSLELYDCSDARIDRHFRPVDPTSHGYRVQVNGAMMNALPLEEGDEIGVFDGTRCVGAAIVNNQWPLVFDTWELDTDFLLPGFLDGQEMTFRYWLSGEGREKTADPVFIPGFGDGFFGHGPYAELNLSAFDEAQEPVIEVDQDTLFFGSTELHTSIALQLVVFNRGNVDLQIDSVTVTHSDFSVEPAFDLLIAPNQHDTITVQFLPTIAHSYLDTLTIYSNDQENSELEIICTGDGLPVETDHFQPVEPTEIPYPILVNDASIDLVSLEYGDEIAVFDDTLCVGAEVVIDQWPVTVIAWEYDPWLDNAGFTHGNVIQYRIWDKDQDLEYLADAVYVTGNGSFGDGPYSVVSLEAAEVSVDETTLIPSGFRVYPAWPNPFNSSFTVQLEIASPVQVTFTLFNAIGETVLKREKQFNAGINRESFALHGNGRSLHSGVFFLRIETSSAKVTQKIIYLK